ncbi:hypothetical protein ABNK63_00460 [Rhodanobacter sp. IGA1.0]|uniref:Uncharacterized protein n=1 Tax=Rhodanobacter sp. IGA1.0 TaxID=3158582 RepID=A0AAU7QL74_9GAMM
MICQEIIRGIVTLLVGLAIAWIGLLIYFRQKEYELVKQRYLENSVDLISAEIETLAGAFGHNWARCLHILKEFRDSEDKFDQSQLALGFVDVSGSKFQRPAHHRLRTLVQTDTFWEVYQLALSFYHSANSVIEREIPHTLRAKMTGDLTNAPYAGIVDRALDELKKLDAESQKFAELLGALQSVASELEQENLSFKDVRTFSKRRAIVASARALKDRFASELSSRV